MDMQQCSISTQHSIPPSVPQKHIRTNVPSWEEAYGEKTTPKAETMHEKIQRYKEKVDRQNASQPYRSRDKGAR